MNTQTVDRTFFEIIRRATVSAGYLPDVTLYATEDAYLAAKEDIRVAGKYVIEVYGVGTPQMRDARNMCRIVIDRISIKPGTVYTGEQKVYSKQENGTFKKYSMPESTSNVLYEIRCVTDNTEYERILYNIVNRSIGIMKMLNAYDSVSNTFLADSFLSQRQLYTTLKDNDVFEYFFRQEVVDVWLEDADDLNIIVQPINTINWALIKMPGLIVPEVENSSTMDIQREILVPE